MAKVKVKIGGIKKFIPNLNNAIRTESFKELVELIKSTIQKGLSPVAQIGRFIRYSESYRESIERGWKATREKNGQKSPVNMTLSGDMIRSLSDKPGQKGRSLGFTDKKAVYHDETGAGKSKVIRRLLPTRPGETFSNLINRKFVEKCKEVVRRLKK